MDNDILKKRVKWLSRRGLLELDILLAQFISSSEFDNLSDTELQLYSEILDWQDHDFLQIINGTKSIENLAILKVITKIKSCSKSKIV